MYIECWHVVSSLLIYRPTSSNQKDLLVNPVAAGLWHRILWGNRHVHLKLKGQSFRTRRVGPNGCMADIINLINCQLSYVIEVLPFPTKSIIKL